MKSRSITFYAGDEYLEKLSQLSAKTGLSKSEILRQLIDKIDENTVFKTPSNQAKAAFGRVVPSKFAVKLLNFVAENGGASAEEAQENLKKWLYARK